MSHPALGRVLGSVTNTLEERGKCYVTWDYQNPHFQTEGYEHSTRLNARGCSKGLRDGLCLQLGSHAQHKQQLPLPGMCSQKQRFLFGRLAEEIPSQASYAVTSRSESPPVLLWDPLLRRDPINLESECHRGKFSHVLIMCFSPFSQNPWSNPSHCSLPSHLPSEGVRASTNAEKGVAEFRTCSNPVICGGHFVYSSQ